MYNIVAAIFEVESEGYQALTTLAKTPILNDTTVLQMALVKRDNGYLKICDSFDSGIHSTNDTLIGGLVGSVVGMLGGPIGMLLMGSYGTLVGSMVDAGDSLGSASLIEKVAEKLQDGDTAMIALADETNEAELDNALAGYKVTVARFDAVVIAEEVEEAQKIQKEMARQTRKQLRDAKKQERKEKREARREKIKSDFAAFRAKFKKNKE
jgi:uncharacterized membrane protein